MSKICPIEGCHRAVWKGTLCNPHYRRSIGEVPLGQPIKEFNKQHRCTAAGCQRQFRSGQYCDAHYRQMLYNGTLKPILVRTARSQFGLAGDEPTYPAAHGRVNALWGTAKNYPCVRCGSSARQWAYDGMDSGQLYGPQNPWNPESTWLYYSRVPEFYMPMCVGCHRSFDIRKAYRELHEYRQLKAAISYA